MSVASDFPPLRILHVLTLNGRNGEYGGPVRVARELCAELNRHGHSTHIFSGALKGSEPIADPGLSESYVVVKPLSKKKAVSSLWSWRLTGSLGAEIRKADIVHIHFARDLIPFLAAAVAIILRKPFVTQTHGMIISDGRSSTRITDKFLTRPLINKSQTNLVLTGIELAAVSQLGVKSPSAVLPNGISVSQEKTYSERTGKKVVFCSRLDKRKGISKFIELADTYRDSGLRFEIYGPDGGELQLVRNEIDSRNLEGILIYMGALPSREVYQVLRTADLLVLPSKDEPFPMIILEALAVGTPVLVMPSCGFASTLNKFNRNYVAAAENQEGLAESFEIQFKRNFTSDSAEQVQNFCIDNFEIAKVTDNLQSIYRKSVSDEG